MVKEGAEYVLGIAIIIAALLVSASVWLSADSLQEAIKGIKLTVPANAAQEQAQPEEQEQQQEEPEQEQEPQVFELAGLDYSSAHFEGDENASIVFAEYSDFECPFCGKAQPTLEQLKGEHSGVKFLYRHFPLSFHPYAQKAGEASECAAIQGKFWEMHDKLYENSDALGVEKLKEYAAELELDTQAFDACLDNGDTAQMLQDQFAEGSSIGIRGTPGFLVFSTKGKDAALEAKLMPIAALLQSYGVDSAVVEVQGAGTGIVFAGALPYENFQEIMNAFN